MSAIGSLVFCTDCGNLLDGSGGDEKAILLCDVCGASNRDTSARTIKTVSQPSAFPSSLRQRLRSDVQTASTDDDPRSKDAVIQERCEKCGREEVRFYTQQLRSADEGSTVFYHCECGNKWTANN
ncbi:hypothetical protein NA57DRAFT_52486 [Rhizodiscina lignyota]|uniref:DNA-directed RNA polymerase subunit n=1 Tax=Rhizodiscina lignyota TaxID=1504668 RepID=A0A9P4IPD2_9PEZI|nr:hypothetical protein NA57DRAFT_52486 [Rhizodiscina lignyota]